MSTSGSLGVNTAPGVYTGVWVNWSRGEVLGATLTLSQRSGALLIAFIALFVSFVGARTWRIACYVLHRSLSKHMNQDAFYHQRQAVLRNSASSTTGLTNWARLAFAWRSHQNRKQLLLRLGPIAVFTTVVMLAFGAAGILSSRLATMTGDEVLIRSPTCGVNILGHAIPGQDKNPAVDATSEAVFTTLLPFLAQRLVYYDNYAESCYSSEPDPRDCSLYVKPQLQPIIERNASCPFSEEMCTLKDGNIRIDTGYLNSNDDLGFNTKPEDRFLYRRVTHCAPIVGEGHTKTANFSSAGFERPYAQVYYGPTLPTENSTLTYQYPMSSLEEYAFQSSTSGSAPDDYTIGYTYANVINGTLAFNHALVPIESLNRTDADVTLVFLSANQVLYPLEVNDPWYSAHQTIPGFTLNFTGWQHLSLKGHFADNTISTLGCAKSYQVCLPDSKGDPGPCSRMGGKQELDYLLQDLPTSEEQVEMISWMIMASMTGNELDAFVETLGQSSLSSRYSVVDGFSGPIPDNQWQLDVEHWHAATLAALQGSAVDAATGPSSPAMQKFWVKPATDAQKNLCNNQKILSSAHTNFNVFGLALTFAIGGFIVAISVLMQPLIEFYENKHDKHTHSRLEWCANGTLQLQRLAHEELGVGLWEKCTKAVPICQSDQLLGALDIGVKGHPVLRPPPVSERGSQIAVRTAFGIPRAGDQKNVSIERVGSIQGSLDSRSPTVVAESPTVFNNDKDLEIGVVERVNTGGSS